MEEAYPVAFQLKDQTLFTLRTGDSRIFADTVRKMKISKEQFHSDADVLLRLFETQIDYEADKILMKCPSKYQEGEVKTEGEKGT